MNDFRKQLLRQRIHYCRAQVDLAKQNMVQCDEKEKRQQELVTHINEILERMEEELKALKARWNQMKEEQRIKEVKWKVVWQSKLLMGAPQRGRCWRRETGWEALKVETSAQKMKEEDSSWMKKKGRNSVTSWTAKENILKSGGGWL